MDDKQKQVIDQLRATCDGRGKEVFREIVMLLEAASDIARREKAEMLTYLLSLAREEADDFFRGRQV